MNIHLVDNLPFISISITYNDKSIEIPKMLIDTGSGTTVLSADIVSEIGITPAPNDIIYSIRGVGGRETVFSRKIDNIRIGDNICDNFEVEIGGMDYGFEINGILGMDLLTHLGIIIDLKELKISFAP